MSPAPRQGDSWPQRLLPLDEHVPLRERTVAMVLADLPRVFPVDAGYQLRNSGPGQVLVSYTRRPTWALAAAVILAVPTLGLGLLLLVARQTHRCGLQFLHEPTMTDPDQAVVHVTGELPADRWEMVQVVAGAVAHPAGSALGGDPSEWLEPTRPDQGSITGMLGFSGGLGDFPAPRAGSGLPPISPASGFPGAYGEAPPPPVGRSGADPFDFGPGQGLGEAEHTQRAPQRDLYGDLDLDPEVDPEPDPGPPPRHGRAPEPSWEPPARGAPRPADDPFPPARHRPEEPRPGHPAARPEPARDFDPVPDDPFPVARHQASPDGYPPAPAGLPAPGRDAPGPAAPGEPDFDSLFRGPSAAPPVGEAPISRAPFALPEPGGTAHPAPGPGAVPPFPEPGALLPGAPAPDPDDLPPARRATPPPEPDPDDPPAELPTRRARRAAGPPDAYPDAYAEPSDAYAEPYPQHPADEPEERTVLRSDALPAPLPASAPGEAMLEFDTGERVPVPAYGLLGRNPSPSFNDVDATLLPVEDPDRSVSKTHLAIGIAPDGIWVMDRHSTNGVEITYRGDTRKLKPGERVLVARGTLIKFGDRQLYLR